MRRTERQVSTIRVASPAVQIIVRLVYGSLFAGLAACQVATDPLPAGVPDPSTTRTPSGAQDVYEGALATLRNAFAGAGDAFVPTTGLLTDELETGDIGELSLITPGTVVDSRILPEYTGTGTDNVTPSTIVEIYGLLQNTRAEARQARGYLHAYAPQAPKALTGHMYAVEGYADVFLADLFCSGVPLSTLDFGKDFTYQPGSSTQDVYERAVTYFDSALTLVADSNRILNLARMGKGRALLALGQYAQAAAAVAQVPDGYQYALQFNGTATSTSGGAPMSNQNFVTPTFNAGYAPGIGGLTMVDREGGNGLPFLSRGDPRSVGTANGFNDFGVPMFRPLMYDITGDSPVIMASGIEARLIAAEAALQAGGNGWLTTLNTLRTDGTLATQPDGTDPTKTDTVWNAGSGGVAGLAPLRDPGTVPARVTMLFTERAYWLFLTGHRQGDLRRLIRQYGRAETLVYPVGAYTGAFDAYGTDVTAPIPGAERLSNPLFKGCRSRGA